MSWLRTNKNDLPAEPPTTPPPVRPPAKTPAKKKSLPTVDALLVELYDLGKNSPRKYRREVANCLMPVDPTWSTSKKSNRSFQRNRIVTAIEMVMELLA